jgi:hypothetical protein
MTNIADLENFTKVIESSVGRRLEKNNYWFEDFKGYSDIKNRPAYLESVKIEDKQYEHFRYLPKLYLDFGQHPRDEFVNPFSIRPYCTWHILKNAKSLCSYVGLHDTDGFLKSNLELIQNHTVTQVFFVQDKFNLFLEFDNSYWLGIFPNNLGFNIGVRSGYWYIHNKELGYRYIASSY